MKTTKILPSESDPLRISSLPTRPTAPTGYGGCGYTSSDMKAAFDRLPLLLIRRFNSLLDDIYADKDASLLSVLKTGLGDEHTVADLIDDLKNGSFSSYITVSGESLATVIEEIRYDIQSLYQQMSPYGITYSATRDGAHQSPRAEASEEGADE